MPAKVVATDPKKDLALLKIPDRIFRLFRLANRGRCLLWIPVLAMGFPMFSTIGYDVSAYDGKINAIRRI